MPLAGRQTTTPHQPARRHAPRRRAAAALFACVAAAAALPPPAALAKDPVASYEQLFGAEERRVGVTGSTKDDAKFAQSLLEKATSLADDPALLDVVYQKAYDFGLKDPDGFATAAEALKRMGAAGGALTREQLKPKQLELMRAQLKRGSPEQRAAAANVLVDDALAEGDRLAADRKYADAAKRFKEGQSVAASVRSPRADELDARAKEATARQGALDRAAKLQPRVDANDPQAVAQAFELYLLDLDDPAAAAPLALAHPDPATKQIAALLGKQPDALKPADLLALAGWYAKVGTRSTRDGKAAALGRSLGYYGQFLAAHDKQDADRLKAAEALKDVARQLAQADPNGDRVVIWNSHHGTANNAGTLGLNLVLLKGKQPAWQWDNIALPWSATKDVYLPVPLPRGVAFDAVRVEVTKWHDAAGSLAELQVFRGGRNVALGLPVATSGAFNDDFRGMNLTDGVTTSGGAKIGYWMLPLKQPGWAEVDLTAQPTAPQANGAGPAGR